MKHCSQKEQNGLRNTPSFLYFFPQVETKDALLHAINEEYVEAVEVLLEHEEQVHREGELHVRPMVKEKPTRPLQPWPFEA